MIDQSDAHEVGLANGVFDALVAISGYLCARLRGGSDVIRAIYPELGRSIQRDVMTTNIRRADMEALRHGK